VCVCMLMYTHTNIYIHNLTLSLPSSFLS
jgi:hypothetical protein